MITTKSDLSSALIKFCQNHGLKENLESAYIVFMQNPPYHLKFKVDELENVVNLSKTYLPQSTEFFKLLFEENYLKGVEYCASEKQYPEPNMYSGMMFDIDAYSEKTQTQLTRGTLDEIVKFIASIIKETLDLPESFETHAAVIKKPELTRKIELVQRGESKIQLYKDGAHILFPGIKVKKEVKRFIMSKCEGFINSFLIERGYDKEIKPFDRNSEHVMVRIYGSTFDKTQHQLVDLYKITFGTYNFVESLPSSVYAYEKSKGKAVFKYNICLELSIHYNGELITKRNLNIKNNISTQLAVVEKVANEIPSYEEERLRIQKAVANLTLSDPQAKEIVSFLDLLKKERGILSSSGINTDWNTIARNLLIINPEYKCIIVDFSMKCDPSGWMTRGSKMLSMVISDVSERLALVKDDKRQSMDRIKSMAKDDNPAGFERINELTLMSRVKALLRNFMHVITYDKIAQLVAQLYAGRFYYVQENIPGIRDQGYWLVYVTDLIAREREFYRPYVWKYCKCYNLPRELDSFLTKELCGLFESIAEQYDHVKESLEAEEQKKLGARFKKIQDVIVKLGCQNSITNITNRLKRTLNNDDIVFELDDPAISTFGVSNGIIVFHPEEKRIEFVEGPSKYKITRTTRTKFVKYDENNPAVIKCQNILKDIIPDDMDRKCILMSIAEGLVKHQSQRFLHLWYSDGSSGKSTIGKLIHNALGQRGASRHGDTYGYSCTINPDVLMKEKINPDAPDNHLVNLDGMMVVIGNEAACGEIKSHIFKRLKESDPKRRNFGDNKPIDFPGVMIIPSNGKSTFSSNDEGNSRRVLFFHYPITFVYPDRYLNLPNQKIRNDEHLRWASHSIEAGEAFLSILTQMWLELMNDYDGSLENIMRKSSIHKQTAEYISAYNPLEYFIMSKTKQCKGLRTTLAEFCEKYADWLAKDRKKVIKAIDALTSVKNSSLDKYIVNDLTGEYLDGIEVIL